MSEADADTERTAVKTYVPAYQKEWWRDHADDLGMSLSEFVRTMVQAGRRGFGADVAEEAAATATSSDDGVAPPPEADDGVPPAAADGGQNLEDRVLEALADGEPRSWDDLLAAVTDDVAGRLEETLQSNERIQHSGRQGGYTLTDDER